MRGVVLAVVLAACSSAPWPPDTLAENTSGGRVAISDGYIFVQTGSQIERIAIGSGSDAGGGAVDYFDDTPQNLDSPVGVGPPFVTGDTLVQLAEDSDMNTYVLAMPITGGTPMVIGYDENTLDDPLYGSMSTDANDAYWISASGNLDGTTLADQPTGVEGRIPNFNRKVGVTAVDGTTLYALAGMGSGFDDDELDGVQLVAEPTDAAMITVVAQLPNQIFSQFSFDADSFYLSGSAGLSALSRSTGDVTQLATVWVSDAIAINGSLYALEGPTSGQLLLVRYDAGTPTTLLEIDEDGVGGGGLATDGVHLFYTGWTSAASFIRYIDL